jgi:hypothetical protein
MCRSRTHSAGGEIFFVPLNIFPINGRRIIEMNSRAAPTGFSLGAMRHIFSLYGATRRISFIVLSPDHQRSASSGGAGPPWVVSDDPG